jgi:hypothetical protein
MIWFFERHHARLRYEIRRQTDGPNYELVITFPDGRQEVEQYDDPSALTERSILLDRALRDEGWQRPHAGPRSAGRSARS